VKALLDPSVLVATFHGDAEHHDPSIDVFLRHKKNEACCAVHSLAEVYSSLTGMPGKDRASADEAMLFLESVRARLTIVVLNEDEYLKALEASAALGVAGGGIYDALLGRCALKARAEVIYTWNEKHFRRLGPEIAGRVAAP
jgi:predicted nucleic acid-binding protein